MSRAAATKGSGLRLGLKRHRLVLREDVVWIEAPTCVLVELGRLLNGAGCDVGFFDLLLAGGLVELILGQSVLEQRRRD